jgi:hypothetical protein
MSRNFLPLHAERNNGELTPQRVREIELSWTCARIIDMALLVATALLVSLSDREMFWGIGHANAA